MEKDQYGISLKFYGIIAFVLAFLGQILLCGVLLGFVILNTKNQWVVKQVMQAFFLALFSSCVNNIFGIFTGISFIPILGGIVASLFGIISGLISLLILIFVLSAIMKINKGEDASIPFFADMAKKICEA